VAYTKQMGGKRVFVMDLATGAEQQITSGLARMKIRLLAGRLFHRLFLDPERAAQDFITTRHGAAPGHGAHGRRAARMPPGDRCREEIA
jgi:hypothetical protein